MTYSQLIDMKNIPFQLKDTELLKPPKVGDIVEGKIVKFGRSACYLDLGRWGTGIIYGREFYLAKDALKEAKIGDKIFAKIIELDNEEGYIELSLSQAGEELGWEKLKQKKEKDEVLTVRVLGANKGGLIVEAEGLRGFLPASQLSPEHYPRVEGQDKSEILQKLQKLIGKKLEVKVLTIEPKKEILIFSEKAKELEKIKNILTKYYKVGDIVEGEITGVVDFGAFIRFKLLPQPAKELKVKEWEGLIHISELDWQLIEDPSEIVKVGDKVKAKITEIDDDGRICLSLKALKENPWEKVKEKFKKGDIIEGKVKKINPFGAFVEVAPKIQGLVHISEFGTETKMREKLKVGKSYKFQILQIDPSQYKMTLKLVEE